MADLKPTDIINEKGLNFNIKVDPQQLALIAAGGFIVMFLAFLGASLLVKRILG